MGGKLLDICLGNDFLDLTPKAKSTKAKITKLDYVKLKSFSVQQRITKLEQSNLTMNKQSNLKMGRGSE